MKKEKISEEDKNNYILTFLKNIKDRFIPSVGLGKIRLLPRTEFPRTIYVELTNYCNANCIMCPRDKLTRPLGFMEEKLYKKIIDECTRYKEFKFLTLHNFGESFLDKDFIEKLGYAKKRKIPVTRMCTTASLLTYELSKKLILSGLDELKINFYGTTKKEYENIHKNLNFETSLNNIKGFLRLKKRLGTKTPSIKIQYLIDARKNILQNIYLCLKFYIQWIRYMKVQYTFLHNFSVGRDYNKATYKGDVIKCHYPFGNQIHILWNGDAVPCVWDYNGSMVLGNVYKSSIKDIWLGSEYQKFRTAHKNKDFRNYSICERCDLWALPRTRICGPIPEESKLKNE